LVVGEDLGVVPDEMRPGEAGVRSLPLQGQLFEKTPDEFAGSREFDRWALALQHARFAESAAAIGRHADIET